MQRPPGGPERLFQSLERSRIVVIAVDIIQEFDKASEVSVAEAPAMLETVFGARPKLFEAPAGFGHADDGDIEAFVANEALQGREDLLIGEIAGRAEEDEGV